MWPAIRSYCPWATGSCWSKRLRSSPRDRLYHRRAHPGQQRTASTGPLLAGVSAHQGLEARRAADLRRGDLRFPGRLRGGGRTLRRTARYHHLRARSSEAAFRWAPMGQVRRSWTILPRWGRSTRPVRCPLTQLPWRPAWPPWSSVSRPAFYEQQADRTDRMATQLEAYARAKGLPLHVPHIGSIFWLGLRHRAHRAGRPDRPR